MANVYDAMKKHAQEQAAERSRLAAMDSPAQTAPDGNNEGVDRGQWAVGGNDNSNGNGKGEDEGGTPSTRAGKMPSTHGEDVGHGQWAVGGNGNSNDKSNGNNEDADKMSAARVGGTPATRTARRKAEARFASSLRAYHDRGGRISEEYRGLRTSLLAQCNQRGFCCMVTSALPGEGKSVTCLNFAMVLAERVNQNTLVIDADLRRRRLADMMDLSRSPGLAECLRGQSSLAEAVQRTCFNNLAVLTAGHVKGGQVAELLGRPELEKLLADAQRMFDYVLIDTPPVNGVSDTGIMGRACSQAMLVVRMHRTQRDAVKRAWRCSARRASNRWESS